MARFQVGLPVEVRALVAPFLDVFNLFGRPRVEVDRLDARDVHAHAAVDTRATNAHEAAEVGRRPSRICRVASGGAQERGERDACPEVSARVLSGTRGCEEQLTVPLTVGAELSETIVGPRQRKGDQAGVGLRLALFSGLLSIPLRISRCFCVSAFD